MSSIPGKVRIAILGALAVAVVLVPAGSASAQTLNGLWGPFTRCPVDSPPMLATDGVDKDPTCIASNSPNGEIKLGNSVQTTGNTNLQVGGVIDDGVVAPLIQGAGGALVSDPVEVEGGLLALMCPSDVPLVSAICDGLVGSELNAVTATVQPAGEPSGFSLSAGLSQGRPIITVPVKVKLTNPVLGPNCTIGSDAQPIILRPQNNVQPVGGSERADVDGTPNPEGVLTRIQTNAEQGDNTFAVPGASGCGLLGVLNSAVNLQQGLPSPSGNNHLILNDATSSVMITGLTPVTGQQFADGWHAAEQP